jgi:hypothetical protein
METTYSPETLIHRRLQKISFFIKAVMFWDITLCKPVRSHRRFGGTYLKIKAISSSETSADFHGTFRLHIHRWHSTIVTALRTSNPI